MLVEPLSSHLMSTALQAKHGILSLNVSLAQRAHVLVKYHFSFFNSQPFLFYYFFLLFLPPQFRVTSDFVACQALCSTCLGAPTTCTSCNRRSLFLTSSNTCVTGPNCPP